jgi:hypothetical protein
VVQIAQGIVLSGCRSVPSSTASSGQTRAARPAVRLLRERDRAAQSPASSNALKVGGLSFSPPASRTERREASEPVGQSDSRRSAGRRGDLPPRHRRSSSGGTATLIEEA